MRPLRAAPADRRPGHRRSARAGAGPILGHHQHDRNEATTALLATTGPSRLHGVRVIGVDEYRWAHTRHAAGEGYVIVIVDLTPVVENSGRARLLDLVAGRSAAALTTWLAARTPTFREQIQIVAMDGFGGYKNAATSASPTRSPSWTPSTSSRWPGPSWTSAASASSRTPRAPRPHR